MIHFSTSYFSECSACNKNIAFCVADLHCPNLAELHSDFPGFSWLNDYSKVETQVTCKAVRKEGKWSCPRAAECIMDHSIKFQTEDIVSTNNSSSSSESSGVRRLRGSGGIR